MTQYPDPRHVRACDTDRNRTAQTLHDAYAHGCLTGEEHSERIDRLYSAKMLSDLDMLTADLPALVVTPPRDTRQYPPHQIHPQPVPPLVINNNPTSGLAWPKKQSAGLHVLYALFTYGAGNILYALYVRDWNRRHAPPPPPAPPRPDVRACDADRDSRAQPLHDAYAHGYLTGEEHSERIDRLYSAKMLSDLDKLTADLPAPAPSERGPYDWLNPRKNNALHNTALIAAAALFILLLAVVATS